MGACAVHAHAAGKPYRAIVMCPPHLVETWQKELHAIFPDNTVEIRVLEKWRELLTYPREKPTKPSWLIIGRDPGEERAVLACFRRERLPRHSPLPRLRFAVAKQGRR